MFVWELTPKPLIPAECDAAIDAVFVGAGARVMSTCDVMCCVMLMCVQIEAEYPIPRGTKDCRPDLDVIARSVHVFIVPVVIRTSNPPSSASDPVCSDYIFLCANHNVSNYLAKVAPTYRYLFNHSYDVRHADCITLHVS